MNCPHCHKPISRRITGLLGAYADSLRTQGLSIRQIQEKLEDKGCKASLPTIGRFFKGR